MWVVVPVAWLYLGSQMQKGSTPSLGPYVLVLVGIVLSMVIIGKLLGWMDRVYAIVIGVSRQKRIQAPWPSRCAANANRAVSARCWTA